MEVSLPNQSMSISDLNKAIADNQAMIEKQRVVVIDKWNNRGLGTLPEMITTPGITYQGLKEIETQMDDPRVSFELWLAGHGFQATQTANGTIQGAFNSASVPITYEAAGVALLQGAVESAMDGSLSRKSPAQLTVQGAITLQKMVKADSDGIKSDPGGVTASVFNHLIVFPVIDVGHIVLSAGIAVSIQPSLSKDFENRVVGAMAEGEKEIMTAGESRLLNVNDVTQSPGYKAGTDVSTITQLGVGIVMLPDLLVNAKNLVGKGFGILLRKAPTVVEDTEIAAPAAAGAKTTLDAQTATEANAVDAQVADERILKKVQEAEAKAAANSGEGSFGGDPSVDDYLKRIPKPPRGDPTVSNAIKELEQGMKQSLPGEPLPLGYQLTPGQTSAMQVTVRQIIDNTIRTQINKGADFNVTSVVNQLSNPRFRFLDQVPDALKAITTAINDPRISPDIRQQLNQALTKAMNLPH